MIKFFDNLKIKQKLTMAFTLVLLLTALIAAFSINMQWKTNYTLMLMEKNQVAPMGQVVDIYNSFQRVRFQALKAVSMSASTVQTEEEEKAITDSVYAELDYLNDAIDELIQYAEADSDVTELNVDELKSVKTTINEEYMPYVEEILEHANAEEYEEAVAALSGAVPIAAKVSEPIQEQLDGTILGQEEVMNKLEVTLERAKVITVSIVVIVILLSIVISQVVATNISKKIKVIANSVKKVADGDFSDSEVFNSRDELGQLSRDISTCVDTIHHMVADTIELGRRQGEGELSYRLDADAYSGQYRDMMNAVNEAFNDLLIDIKETMVVLSEYSAGNFTVTLRQLKGEKININKGVDKLKNNLEQINDEISKIITASASGDLRHRAEADQFSGDWKAIVSGLNNLLDTICEPFDEVGAVLGELSKGNLSARVEGDYKGDYAVMKNIINNSMSSISGYISTIDEVLEAINNNDLTVYIDNEFVGDFNNLKVAINHIIDKLNDVFKEFLVGADEVAIGAHQISNSSISLADGAAEQVSSLNSLTSGVERVSESSAKNAENANRANDISETSKSNAITGDSQMKQMLVSMNEISESSNEISNIIKVIEDIAFQTNLLALNAAVEAARAGVHGKGFAVVADEVRTLAARSSQAAKETTELIQTSISRVAFGSELAKATASALDEIVTNVSDVANIIEEISNSSKEQAQLVDLINSEIGTVESVILKTSAASEEGVSTAEELSSQSTVLRDLIGTFKLSN